MRRTQVTGRSGIVGWLAEPEDMALYLGEVEAAWTEFNRWWELFRPAVSTLRIAYDPPGRGDKPVAIVVPVPHFMMMLMHGGVVRHMRVVDSYGPRGVPVFEGTGEVMGSMTERQAIEFLAWKDVPRGVNHWAIVDEARLPSTRECRALWRLMDNGEVGVLS